MGPDAVPDPGSFYSSASCLHLWEAESASQCCGGTFRTLSFCRAAGFSVLLGGQMVVGLWVIYLDLLWRGEEAEQRG